MNLETFLETHPYLAFRLSLEKQKRIATFPQITIRVKEDVEVLFIDGALRCFESIRPFLEKGGHVVFVEGSLAKIHDFLTLPDFPFVHKIDIILPEEGQYREIGWKTLFQKMQFVGKLDELRVWIDSIHMTASEYREFGYRILGNVQANLLHTEKYLDGRRLKDFFQGVPAIVCGSGPSLEEAYGWLSEVGDKALIIAAGSSLPKLVKAGVKAHFAAFVDPEPPLDIYEGIKDFSLPIFYQNRVSRDLFSLHNGRKVWMGSSGGWELEDWFDREIGREGWFFDGGWNAGNFALHIAKHLGCGEIHLVGMDGGERRDLKYGKQWNGGFAPHKERPLLNQSYSFALPDEYSTIDHEKLTAAILKLDTDNLQDALSHYLDTGRKKAETLLDVELVGHPAYEYWLEPLWKIFKPIYMREVKQEFAMKAVFFSDVLRKAPKGTHQRRGIFYFQGKKEGKVERHFPSGHLYAVEHYQGGIRHGEFLTFYETGELKSRVHYERGALHGGFTLYYKNGKKREGLYERGKRVGVHRLWNEEGVLVLEASFHHGKPVGTFQRFHDHGVLMEKVVYQHDGRFDKWLFNVDGTLKYEGKFREDSFRESKYEGGSVVHSREGVWKEGKVVWT